MIPPLLLAACTGAPPVDTSAAPTPAVANIIYDGALPDCLESYSAEVLCAGGGSIPVTASTHAQLNLVPDWFWHFGEPEVVYFAGWATDASAAPCADDVDGARAVYLAEFPDNEKYITGSSDTDPRWIDILIISIPYHYRVPRCSIYSHFATLGRLQGGGPIDPIWALRDPPGVDDRAQDDALVLALDTAWMIESHRATLAYAGTDRTRLYAVGTEISDDTARYRTCRVDGTGYASTDGWDHDVWQVEYTIDRVTGRATLDRERVRVASCDRPIEGGVW